MHTDLCTDSASQTAIGFPTLLHSELTKPLQCGILQTACYTKRHVEPASRSGSTPATSIDRAKAVSQPPPSGKPNGNGSGRVKVLSTSTNLRSRAEFKIAYIVSSE